jgi:hypothetical protein
MRRALLLALLLAACRDRPPTPIPQAKVPLPALELKLQPAGKRAYELTIRQRVAVKRHGAGPGAMTAEVRMRMRIVRQDRPAPEGLSSTISVEEVEATPLGPMGAIAARAARGLRGARATFDVDPRGRVKGFTAEGPAGAKALLTLIGRAFAGMSPALPEGTKGAGARWGDTISLPLAAGEATVPVSFTTSYVSQGAGQVGRHTCALLNLDLRVGANAPVPGARPSAANATGTGRGELCLDPATGALRAGTLDLTIKTGFALRDPAKRRIRPKPVPLHLEHTLRLRIDAREVEGTG